MGRAVEAQRAAGLDSGLGMTLRFTSKPGLGLDAGRLDRSSAGIALLAAGSDGEQQVANAFVPEGRISEFHRLLDQYADVRKDGKKGPRNHSLLSPLDDIQPATLQHLWMGPGELPAEDAEAKWWEVWVPRLGTPGEEPVQRLRALAGRCSLEVGRDAVVFPERAVVMLCGTVAALSNSLIVNSVAGFRCPAATAAFFQSMHSADLGEWVNELLERTSSPSPGDDCPYVCILDTGVNQGHPLLAPVLARADLHAVERAWGTADSYGHGTEMAGLVAYATSVTRCPPLQPWWCGTALSPSRSSGPLAATPGAASSTAP